MTRVLVVSPALAVRVGLRAMLQTEVGIEVIGEAAHLGEISLPVEVDVILLDPGSEDLIPPGRLPDLGQAVVVLISSRVNLVQELNLSSGQGWGLLLPEVTQEELGMAVRAAAEGLVVGAPILIQRLLDVKHNGEPLKSEAGILSNRENEVLQLMAQGLANKQIAVILDISPHTVKFHIASIYSKLQATSRTEAVRLGYQQGLIIL